MTSTMDAAQFVAKWQKAQLTERSAYQQHFLDLCDLLGHGKPAALDPKGEFFTFERGVAKSTGRRGWADVWKRNCFAIEYKGKHKDLDAAYDQLLLYRASLENPPLLAVCDTDRIIIHTNFTGTVEKIHTIPLTELHQPRNLDILTWMFHDTEKLRPSITREAITIQVADRLANIAQAMRGRGVDPHNVASFLDRIVFRLFAEDIELLPRDLFTRLIEATGTDSGKFFTYVNQLFKAMAEGGNFGLDTIHHFNGNLFDSSAVVTATYDEIQRIKAACKADWSQVDPSVFGTLFERGMDPAKRSELGAHYTSREDIEMIVDPVVIRPLRREWDELRMELEKRLTSTAAKPKATARPKRSKKSGQKTPSTLILEFLLRLQSVTVLDPACGSGNFLYVVLQKLKDLEKEVMLFADDHGLGKFLPGVGPWQLHGIEKSQYAYELAQVSIWIGYIQWQRANGYRTFTEPILRRMDTFECKDAVLDLSDPKQPTEPDWPEVEFIVGNPPFLGGKKMRTELDRDASNYVDSLFTVWKKRVKPEADLCCYWFEKARHHIEQGKCKRAGLLATQGIRGGANRETLKRIKASGDIFFGESDRDWIPDGATVHVSMVGFDKALETVKTLNGQPVAVIHSNLTAEADITQAKRLEANLDIAYMGDTKGGKIDIDRKTALALLSSPNPGGSPGSDVILPWINGLDVTRRYRDMWIIDFGTRSEEEASLYEEAFEHVRDNVYEFRQKNNRESYKEKWWVHVDPRPSMWSAIGHLSRFIVTPRVTKHRLFVWIKPPTVPDCQVIAFGRSDDYFFGILHSLPHEVWSMAQGTQVRERESGFRYTPTSCFETSPSPIPPTSSRRRSPPPPSGSTICAPTGLTRVNS
jgi:type II restriction/modification system DNA methylase subunit YeeA